MMSKIHNSKDFTQTQYDVYERMSTFEAPTFLVKEGSCPSLLSCR